MEHHDGQNETRAGDQYLKGLAKTLKGTLDEAKKQNLIVSYKILLGDAATPQDFNILINGGIETLDPGLLLFLGGTDDSLGYRVELLTRVVQRGHVFRYS